MCVCYTVIGGQLLIFDFIHSQSYVWPPARPSLGALFVYNHLILSQLAHIHIAAPEISSITAIIAFPPIAVCLQRCCQCDVLLIKFDCCHVQVLNQAKAFQPLIVETLAV